MKNTKKVVAIGLCIIWAICLLGCKSTASEPVQSAETTESNVGAESSTETSETAATTSEPVTLVVSSAGTEDEPGGVGLTAFKEKVEELSDGNITIELYFNGVLYSAELGASACIAGDVDMVYTGPNYLTDGSPWLSMFSAGYLIKDYDHLQAVYGGEIGQSIYQRVAEEQGILPLATYYLGARVIGLTEDVEITTPEDLAPYTIRMPASDMYVFLGEALGAKVSPIALSELYTALQTGTVDGEDCPLPQVESKKLYEVLESITLTNHWLTITWPAINLDKWNSLTEEQQGWITEAIEYGNTVCDNASLEQEEELIATFKERGLSIYYPDIDAFAEHVLNEYLSDDEITADWDMDLYQQIVDLG